uniref:Major capsid protein n=1 Tax=Army ant associated microvirus 10 TaxID=3004012 RepID=A0A9Y1MU68_9VIRU|nr:MAG: major capsid protein [Army ant associated microvirus 10]
MTCTNPIIIIHPETKEVQRFQCRKCINCRTARAGEWTNRLVDEATQHKQAIIIVLTYDNKHVKAGKRYKGKRHFTIWYPDVQRYLKRLRVAIERETPGRKFRYYCACEYGEANKRPHYHLVLFGLGSKDKKHITNQWSKGEVMYDYKNRPLTREALAYCAQYVQKKIYSWNDENYYTKRGIMIPQNYMSKGIGKEMALKNSAYFTAHGLCYKPSDEGRTFYTPRYYLGLYRHQDWKIKERIYEEGFKGTLTKKEVNDYIWLAEKYSIDNTLENVQKRTMAFKKAEYRKLGIITDFNDVDQMDPENALRTMFGRPVTKLQWYRQKWQRYHGDYTPQMLEHEYQEGLKIEAIRKRKMKEMLQGNFNASPRDDRLQMAEYIGRTRIPVNVSEVLQTGEDGKTPQGNMAGHAIAVGSSHEHFTYYAQEHGIILGTVVVLPREQFQNKIPRDLLKITKDDFYRPQYAYLSEQEIFNSEVFFQGNEIEDQKVWAYQGRWSELRVRDSVVTGLMRANAPENLSFWNLARNFDKLPAHNSGFIQADIRKDFLAVPKQPTFVITMGWHNYAERPIPAQSEPGLLDHTYGEGTNKNLMRKAGRRF